MGKHAPSAVARTALTLVRRINRQREVKVHDIAPTVATVEPTGIVYGLNDIAQGDDINQRDGRSCSIFNLNIRWNVYIHTSDAQSTFRMIIFRDSMQDNSVVPVVTLVLQTADVVSMMKDYNRTRFQVYADNTYVINQTDRGIVIGQFNRRIKVNTLWAGSSGTQWAKNGLYMLVIGDETTNKPTLRYSSRILFNDF